MGSIAINLLRQVACKVAGREVEVNYSVCVMRGAEGEMGVKDGKPVITLVPWSSPLKTYYFFLHELAHVCMEHDKGMKEINLSPGSIVYTLEDFTNYSNDLDEHSAQGYARALNEIAEKDAWRYAEHGKANSKLLALLNY